jgi:hypothetical protein
MEHMVWKNMYLQLYSGKSRYEDAPGVPTSNARRERCWWDIPTCLGGLDALTRRLGPGVKDIYRIFVGTQAKLNILIPKEEAGWNNRAWQMLEYWGGLYQGQGRINYITTPFQLSLHDQGKTLRISTPAKLRDDHAAVLNRYVAGWVLNGFGKALDGFDLLSLARGIKNLEGLKEIAGWWQFEIHIKDFDYWYWAGNKHRQPHKFVTCEVKAPERWNTTVDDSGNVGDSNRLFFA